MIEVGNDRDLALERIQEALDNATCPKLRENIEAAMMRVRRDIEILRPVKS